MKTLEIDLNYDLALTQDSESGEIRLWEAYDESRRTGESKLFIDREKKKVLHNYNDNLKNVKRNFTEAKHCYFTQLWFGEYPYGSWCWAIRLCKTTGTVKVSTITTEINPSGETDSDYWKRKCVEYTPKQPVLA